MSVSPMIHAKLAQIAASAELTKLKAQEGKHWDRELRNEVAAISTLCNEVMKEVDKRDFY